jgi:light-regulated signal transduction histidine kinase (bacteriophytochrome)
MTQSDETDRFRREMQQFLYAVSHDLQEPFRKVRMFGQRLAAKLEDRLDESARDDLDRILSAAERGQGMIEGLLLLSRLETQRGVVTQVDLNETLAAVCKDLQEKIASSSAVVAVEPLPTIAADAEQMKLLFLSLLDNALKFQWGDRTPTIRVHAETTEAPATCRFLVDDNGIGLEQQYADRVFTVFQRLHPRDVYPGLGLGLAYCQKIVERHAGSIEYEQSAEGGTRFIVNLRTAAI